MNSPVEKTCPSCTATFLCGPVDDQQRCWCENLYHVPVIADEYVDCFCPECLKLTIEKWESAKTGAVELVEGDDYYAEGTSIVFTRRYHLRRGYCCDSGCRHCPYRDD